MGKGRSTPATQRPVHRDSATGFDNYSTVEQALLPGAAVNQQARQSADKQRTADVRPRRPLVQAPDDPATGEAVATSSVILIGVHTGPGRAVLPVGPPRQERRAAEGRGTRYR